ncbi:MAG TPA: prolyl oligopeptidase family serine peptidase [Streptosporangiaceae bacterium]
MRYPTAHRDRLTEIIHGRPVADPYRWLEDPGSAATRAWAQAEQALADAELATLPGQAVLYDLLTRAASDGGGLPRWGGDRAFTVSCGPGADRRVLMVRDQDGRTRVLVDPADLDSTATLDEFAPSPDGRLVACQLSRGGTEAGVLTVVEADSGRLVFGPAGAVRHSPVAWLGSGGLYYVDYHAGPASLRWLDLARGHQATILCATTATTRFSLTVWHDRYLSLSVRQGTAPPAAHLVADLAGSDPARPAFEEVPVDDAALVVGRGRRLYARSYRDAPRGCLVANPGAADARVVLPERSDAVLTGAVLFDREPPPRLVAAYTRDGHTELSVHNVQTGRLLHQVALPGDGAVTALSTHPDGRPCCWLRYSDLVTPRRVLRLDVRSGSVTDESAQAPAAELDATVRRVIYPSADGTEVAMTMVIPGPDASPAAPRPALLTAYGGFGYATDSRFHPEAAAWVKSGGIWASASVRGGGEHGAAWHDAGRGPNKPNAVADLHAAADWLVARGWTAHDRLALLGVSNGGLLTGAALVERPDAYAAVACVAPVLDMVRYENSGLGPHWRAEYGSAAVPAELDWLLSYSPYHRVRPGRRYPPTLLVTFGGDTRVAPLHARKMCAALQHADPCGGPVLLHHVEGVGHGAKPGQRGSRAAATVLSFLAYHTGLVVEPGPVASIQ